MPERPQLAVVDSTPIIALALVGKLDLLQRLYGQVVIPPAVQREVLAGGPGAAGRASCGGQLGFASFRCRIPGAQRCFLTSIAAKQK